MKMRKRNIVILSLIGALCLISYFHHMIQKYSLLETSNEFEEYEEKKLAEISEKLNDASSTDSLEAKQTSGSMTQRPDNARKIPVEIIDSKDDEISEVISKNSTELKNKILETKPIQNANYFIEARLDTNMERERIISLLNEIVNNEYTSEEARETANSEKMKLIDTISKEKVVENLIKSKGFDNTLVLITDHSVSIVLDSKKISDSEMAKIFDIVIRETQFSPDKIKIWNKF